MCHSKLRRLFLVCCLVLSGLIAQASASQNNGTQVWFIPVPAGDMMKLAQQPDAWPQARSRVDVFSLYFIHAYHHEGFVCGNACGPNTYPNLLTAVPEGMYQWLSDRFILAFEGTSIKPHACTEDAIRNQAAFSTNIAISNIEDAGGRLTYISLDEPFASGTATAQRNPFGAAYGGCSLSGEQVARLQRIFNDVVLAEHPSVQFGFIEPYPYFTPDEIIMHAMQLEDAGVRPAYFHLDFDVPRSVRERKNWIADVRRIRAFFAARGIPFGVIIVGGDGTSDQAYMTDAIATMRAAYQAVGVTEHTILQSWAEDPPHDLMSLKHIPNTVPETQSGTHTWFILEVLRYMGIARMP